MSGPEAPLLEVRGLHHTFHVGPRLFGRLGAQPVRAVAGVSLQLRRGETLAVVGESGSGKSTVARCIAGVHEVDRGELRLDGAPYDRALLRARPDLRRRIQMVFQDPTSSLNPRHRVGTILAEPLRALDRGARPADRAARVAELLRDVGLAPDAATRYPHEFSGGQRQRIAIARALAPDPEVVICDEAVSALDVSVQGQVLNLLRRLQRERDLAYLFISHDMAVVRHIADRVAVMYQGEAVETGDVESVFAAPQQGYTRALLGAVPRGLVRSTTGKV